MSDPLIFKPAMDTLSAAMSGRLAEKEFEKTDPDSAYLMACKVSLRATELEQMTNDGADYGLVLRKSADVANFCIMVVHAARKAEEEQ